MNDGNAWFRQHFTRESEGHTHYYLYAYERYQSFRELSEKYVRSESEMYSDVFEYLKKAPGSEGSWSGPMPRRFARRLPC